jgi:hypothetical protein
MEELRTELAESGGEDEEKLSKILVFVETIEKFIVPTIFSDAIYQSLGSEKLVNIIDELVEADQSVLAGILGVFVLLELDPDRGLDRLTDLIRSARGADKWLLPTITQRLYYYYATRTVSAKIRTKFENLIAEIQARLAGQPALSGYKGRVLQDLRKRSLEKEDKDKS